MTPAKIVLSFTLLAVVALGSAQLLPWWRDYSEHMMNKEIIDESDEYHFNQWDWRTENVSCKEALTIGVPKTVEIGVRILAARGALVELGVNPPGRFEWTPLYFKEVRLVGSNAFAIETVRGVRQHAIQHYLDLVADGTIDLTGMLTHTFRLAEWRDAFAAIANQGESRAIKVAFDFR